MCGVPDDEAPELFGSADDHCYVKRQPQTPAEHDAMVNAMRAQELACIRYAGNDKALLRRLVDIGEGDQCDVFLPAKR